MLKMTRRVLSQTKAAKAARAYRRRKKAGGPKKRAPGRGRARGRGRGRARGRGRGKKGGWLGTALSVGIPLLTSLFAGKK